MQDVFSHTGGSTTTGEVKFTSIYPSFLDK